MDIIPKSIFLKLRARSTSRDDLTADDIIRTRLCYAPNIKLSASDILRLTNITCLSRINYKKLTSDEIRLIKHQRPELEWETEFEMIRLIEAVGTTSVPALCLILSYVKN
jgi:hypothetical protein